MIRYRKSIRFTSNELAEFRRIGLNFGHASDQTKLEQELNRWADLITRERPDLLEKIAVAMAAAQGVRLPPKLGAVPADDG